MDKEHLHRFLLTLALIMGFLFVWSEYLAPKPAPAPKPEVATAKPTAQATKSAAPTAPAATERKEATPPAQTAAVTDERQTPLYDLLFTNQPGSLARATLRKFHVGESGKTPNIGVVPFEGAAPPPLRWTFGAGEQSWTDDGAEYRKTSAGETNLIYEKALDNGLIVSKNLTWSLSSYWIEQKVSVTNRKGEPVKLRSSVTLSSGDSHEELRSSGVSSYLGNRPTPLRVSAFINEKAVYWTTEEVLSGKAIPPGEIRWAGFDSRYFLMTAVPVEARWNEIKMSATSRKDETSGKEISDRADLTMIYPPYEIPTGGTQSYTLRLFLGPKDIGVLQGVGHDLDRAIDLGDWLGWIARPMLYFLRWLYSIFPNYGLAIILLTVVVRLLMFPLAQKQARSMRKMQEHKPQMDALKEKFKDDKEGYSRELMSYMRSHKINPMGGCLLILPQLPIFFALYRVLWNSIELRHAPFIFWIRDLSAHDPFFVLPVLLGIAMFLQQKMTPSPGADPAQQAMFKFMPIIFTAMMVFLPAGLNLYIFVSTLWGVVQQYWVQRELASPAKVAEKVSRK
ncbi:MAG: membrane protein insertase YidC [Pseudomonadota bacterium]